MRRLVRQILGAYGIKDVFEAEDGAQGYEMFKRKKADVIITDWMMDRLTGIELTRMVRTADDSPDKFTPIIMLTGYTEMERVVEARDCGVTEFMAKPVSAQGLYDRIGSVIEVPRPFVQIGPYFGPDRRRRIGDFAGNDRRITDEAGDGEQTDQREGVGETENEEALEGVRDRVGSLVHEGS